VKNYHTIRTKRPDRCDKCRKWLPRGSLVFRYEGGYTRCASCAGHLSHQDLNLGPDLGFTLRAQVQPAGPTFADQQALRQAQAEHSEQQQYLLEVNG